MQTFDIAEFGKMRKRPFFRFNGRIFSLFGIIFGIEALIAIFFHDRFIRAFLGDLIITIMICCFLYALTSVRLEKIAIGTFIFACVVEVSQFMDLIGILGLRDSLMAHLIIGSAFDWMDILAYAIGCGIVWVARPLFRAMND
jgi:hypothetical protein